MLQLHDIELARLRLDCLHAVAQIGASREENRKLADELVQWCLRDRPEPYRPRGSLPEPAGDAPLLEGLR